jgi:hypothetical protein
MMGRGYSGRTFLGLTSSAHGVRILSPAGDHSANADMATSANAPNSKENLFMMVLFYKVKLSDIFSRSKDSKSFCFHSPFSEKKCTFAVA